MTVEINETRFTVVVNEETNTVDIVSNSVNGPFVGVGVAAGGTQGQYLRKNSAVEYDTTWGDINLSTSDVTGILPVAKGGTNASTASGARANLSAAVLGANNDITSMTGITGGISSPDFLQLDTAAAASIAVAKLRWNVDTATAAFGIIDGTREVNIGQQMYAYVTNAESVTINKGQAVYLHEAQGNRATVKLAYNTGDATSAKTLGLVVEDIGPNQTGFVITQGVLDKLSTGIYDEGDTLYLGATAGSLTATKPKAPNHLVYIGVVERANNGNGQIYVRVQNGYELDEIHDVQITTPVANNSTIIYNSSSSLWQNKSPSETRTALGLGTIATQNSNNVSISGGSITGITDLAIGDGGTGASTAQNARINLLPSYTGNANKVLALNSGATDVEWVSGGGGAGTVTSVDMSVPTGLTISGNPITTSGTLALSYSSGYSIPTDSSQSNWNTAYGWGDHASAGYLTVAVTSAVAGTGMSVSAATGAVTFTNTAPDQTVVLTAGTGISTSGTYPNFTITNSSPDQTVVLTAGTGISTSGSYPNFTITNSAPDQTVSLSAGTGISITGTYPSFTITNDSPSSGGTVTSIDLSGGTTGLTTSGGPVTTSGTITLAGTLNVGNGGTGAVTLTGVVKGNGTSAFTAGNVSLTSEVTGTLPVGNGGTGATTLTANNVILGNGGSAVQFVAPGTNGNVLKSNGTTWTSAAEQAQVYPGAGIAVSTGSAWGTSKTSPTGDIVGTSDSQALTNKTISADSNTLSGIAASSFVLSNSSGNIDGSASQKAIPSGVVVGTTDTQTLSDKRINPRAVVASGTSGNLTINGDTTDLYEAEGLTGAITFLQPSGTPVDGQKLMIRIKDNGTARAITWTTSAGAFRAVGITLPTTTVLSKVTYVGCVYNSTDSFWDAVATVTQA